MKLFAIEQTKTAYWADFAFYGAVIVGLAATLMVGTPQARWSEVACFAVAGLVGWTALEYVIHRFVFHGIQPFRRWHAEHHARPTAFICAPTILTASLLGGLLFLPAWVVGNVWSACALTLGVLSGYVAYAATHHAIHHWHAKSTWLRQRQRSHFIHHQAQQPCCFGVTSGIWDAACGSRRPQSAPAAAADTRCKPRTRVW
jgi:cyclopropane-fatty-acyl-phospholipid synthase